MSRAAWPPRVVGLLFLLCASMGIGASQLTVLLDTDNNSATGCAVPIPGGSFAGAEIVLNTTINTGVSPPVISGVTRQSCANPATNTLSAPVAVDPGGWPVGIGVGVAGYDAIETYIPSPGLPNGTYRLGATYTDQAIGSDTLVTVNGAAGGAPILFAVQADATPVPTLDQAGLVLLAMLLCAAALWVLRRYPLPPTLVVAVVAIALSTSLWAIVLDGMVGDWAGTPAAALDALGESPPGADISAFFVKLEPTQARLFFRADVKTASAPSAVNDAYTTTAGGPPLVRPAATGLLANDQLGAPAATLTSFGGGNAGGSVTSNAAGTTLALPVGGSLTVNADGSFSFTPANGFTGAFLFSYRLTNSIGTSDGQVTITVNQGPAITSANNATFTVGTSNTFTVTTSGVPKPALSISCAPSLPAGVTFVDNGNGTATLSGSPPAGSGGTYNCTITASNGVGAPATQTFTLTIGQAPTITSANSLTLTAGSGAGLPFTVTATGFPATITYTETGTLPTGVTFNAGTHQLTGAPAANAGGLYNIVFGASNGVNPPASQNFALTVTQAPAITSANNTTFSVGVANSFTVTTTGFPFPTITFGACAPALPTGVGFIDNGNGTGTLSGNPPAGSGGTYNCTVTANNGVGAPASQSFTLTIKQGPVAQNDSYSVVHDTTLNVPAPGVLANDTGVPAPVVSIVTGTGAPCTIFPCTITTAHGSATVNTDGSFTYVPTANTAGPDTFTYNAHNTSGDSVATVTITVTDAPPVVDLNGPPAGIDFGPVAFTEGGGAVAIVDPAQLTVTDADSTQLASATVTITNLLDGAAESLSVNCPGVTPVCSGAIQVTDVVYTPGTGTLTITRVAPLADYQTLLRTLKYSNSSQNPTTTTRDVTVTVNDRIVNNSPLAHAMVTITPVNNAPTITAPNTASTPVNTALVFPGNVSVADVDAGVAAVKVTLTATNGTVTLSTTAGLVVSGNGTATVVSTGPLAAQNTALNGMTFNPTNGYSGPATLKIDIDDQGNTGLGGAMTATKTINITVATPPTVTSTAPINGASAVAANATITINFSASVNVSGTAFKLECPAGTPVAFTVTPASPAASFVLHLTANLPAGTTCTVTVVAAQVTDVAFGQNMAANFVFTFTVDTLPTVTSTVPTIGATNVLPSSTITINFSEPVNATGTAFKLECPAGTPVAFTQSGSPASTFTLTPTAPLPGGTICTVTVVAAQVTDVDAGQNMAANFVFTFTTNPRPTVTTTVPVNGATSVPLSSAITINFSEPVNATASAFTLQCPVGTPIAFSQSASPAASFTLTPSAKLPGGTLCTVTVVANQVTDVDAGQTMAANFTFTFTTDVQPTVTSTVPVNGATNVALASTITINFSEAVNVSGSSFTIACPASVPFTITPASPASTFVLHPVSNLPAGTTCTVTVVASQVTDVNAGSNMAANFVFSFGTTIVVNNDLYPQTLVGNVSTDSSLIPFNVLSNDTVCGSPTISAFQNPSAQGGNVAMTTSGANVGLFTYDPPPGFEGTDTFTYTVQCGTASGTATVSVPISGMIWFINNNASGAADGRLSKPFQTLAAFQAVNNGAGNNPAANDNIFLYESGTNYVGPVTLLAGQKLIGQDATASLSAITGLTPPSSSPSLPAMNSGNATIVNITSAANDVNLGTNNTVRGLTLGNATSDALFGSAFGTLTASDITINTTGRAINLATGTAAATFNSVSSSGSATNNITLSALAGSLTMNGGALANATGNSFNVDQGAATITYTGTIASGSAHSVSITNKSGGTVTLSGAVTDTDTGILMTSNIGATINFTGALSLSTGANTAFNATGGGTISTTDTTSTITTTTGTALNVANTTIGASNLKFKSITAGTAASGPVNGIVLNTTGASGGLVVIGTGSAGSGGTIQRTTGSGISLTSVGGSASFTDMDISNTASDGITANTVKNFSCSLCNITNPGSAANKQGLNLNELSGTASLTNVTVTGATQNGAFIQNTSATLTSLTISGGSYSSTNNAFASAGSGLEVIAKGTGIITTATVSGVTFANNFSSAIQSFAQDTASIGDNTLSANGITVSGCTFTNNGAAAADFDAGTGTGNMKFRFLNNTTITHNVGPTVNVFSSATGTGGLIQGRIDGNQIGACAGSCVGATGTVDSGSTGGAGIRVFLQGVAGNITIVNNIIRATACSRGIEVQTLGPVPANGGVRVSDIVITGNDVNNFSSDCSFPLNDIYLTSDNQAGGAGTTLRADVHSNKIKAAGATPANTDFPFDNLEWLYFDHTAGTAQLVGSGASANAVIAGSQTSGSAKANAAVSLIGGPITTVP